MKRPLLQMVPLAEVLPLGALPGASYMTMSEGQWDAMLAAAYAAGFILLELDAAETPLRAFRRREEL